MNVNNTISDKVPPLYEGVYEGVYEWVNVTNIEKRIEGSEAFI